MLGRNGDAHVDVIDDELPFHDLALFLTGQLVENGSELLSELAVDDLFAIFRDEDDMIFAVPAGVG